MGLGVCVELQIEESVNVYGALLDLGEIEQTELSSNADWNEPLWVMPSELHFHPYIITV